MLTLHYMYRGNEGLSLNNSLTNCCRSVDCVAEHICSYQLEACKKRVQDDVLTRSYVVISEPITCQRSYCCSKKIRKGEKRPKRKIKKPQGRKTLCGHFFVQSFEFCVCGSTHFMLQMPFWVHIQVENANNALLPKKLRALSY